MRFTLTCGVHLLCRPVGSSHELMSLFKGEIQARYKITDLGPISCVLGMKVVRDRTAQTVSLSQEPYINAIITKYNFSDLKPVSIPMDPNVQLLHTHPMSIADTAHMKCVPYRAAVGSLMYLGHRHLSQHCICHLNHHSVLSGSHT